MIMSDGPRPTRDLGTILYVGGFELPDWNAAAHRVVANAMIFRAIGYRVLLLGVTREKPWRGGSPRRVQLGLEGVLLEVDIVVEAEGFQESNLSVLVDGRQRIEPVARPRVRGNDNRKLVRLRQSGQCLHQRRQSLAAIDIFLPMHRDH